MKLDEYLKRVFDLEYHLAQEWYICLFTCMDASDTNKYARAISTTKVEVMLNDEWYPLEVSVNTSERGILDVKDKLWIDDTFISNLDMKTTETTIGRLLCNKILLERPFGNIIKYVNGHLPGSIEANIALLMREGKIEPKQYYNDFCNGVNFLGGLFRIFGVSATEKNTLPPAGIDEYKKKLVAEFDNVYGPNWTKNTKYTAEFKYKLEQYDKEWLKDDPTGDKLAQGGITNSRSKVYLAYGMTNPIGTSNTQMFLINNLKEGYNLNKKEIAATWNDSIAGSYGRGMETQKGGVASKEILRGVSSVKIQEEPCKTKQGKHILVNKTNAEYLFGRYTLDGKRISDPESLIGKEIVVRSPLYCVIPGSSYCKMCVGDNIANNKDGVPLKMLDIGGKILNSMMKKMHGGTVKKEDLDIINSIS